MTIEFKFFIFDDPLQILLYVGDFLPLFILSLFFIFNWHKKRTSDTESKLLGFTGIVILILISIKFFLPGLTISSSPTPEELEIVRVYFIFFAVISPLPYLILGVALLGADLLYNRQKVFKLTYLSASGLAWLMYYVFSTIVGFFRGMINFLMLEEYEFLFSLSDILGMFASAFVLTASIFLSIYATQHDRKFLRWTSIIYISLFMFSGFFSTLYFKLDYIFTHIL